MATILAASDGLANVMEGQCIALLVELGMRHY